MKQLYEIEKDKFYQMCKDLINFFDWEFLPLNARILARQFAYPTCQLANEMVNVVPCPTSLSTLIDPPIACT